MVHKALQALALSMQPLCYAKLALGDSEVPGKAAAKGVTWIAPEFLDSPSPVTLEDPAVCLSGATPES